MRAYNDGNHCRVCKEIDLAPSSLLEDLDRRHEPMDECCPMTRIVCFGEFPRTPVRAERGQQA